MKLQLQCRDPCGSLSCCYSAELTQPPLRMSLYRVTKPQGSQESRYSRPNLVLKEAPLVFSTRGELTFAFCCCNDSTEFCPSDLLTFAVCDRFRTSVDEWMVPLTGWKLGNAYPCLRINQQAGATSWSPNEELCLGAALACRCTSSEHVGVTIWTFALSASQRYSTQGCWRLPVGCLVLGMLRQIFWFLKLKSCVCWYLLQITAACGSSHVLVSAGVIN